MISQEELDKGMQFVYNIMCEQVVGTPYQMNQQLIEKCERIFKSCFEMGYNQSTIDAAINKSLNDKDADNPDTTKP